MGVLFQQRGQDQLSLFKPSKISIRVRKVALGKPTTTHSIFFLYGDSKKLSRCCAKRFLLRGAFSEKEID